MNSRQLRAATRSLNDFLGPHYDGQPHYASGPCAKDLETSNDNTPEVPGREEGTVIKRIVIDRRARTVTEERP